MHHYVIKRTASLLVTLFAASVIIFLAVNAIPGEPAEILARHLYVGLEEVAPPEMVAQVAERYDLNKPLLVQYTEWAGGLFRGDLGYSILYNRPVGDLVFLYLPPTILLTTFSMTFATIIGLLLGIYSALHQNGAADHLIRVVTIFSMSMPSFWAAVMLILVFSVWLGLLPVAGYGAPQYLVLPATALGLHSAASIARIMRTSMLDTMEKPYIVFARSKGLSAGKIILSHALKNALLPVLTVAGMSFGSLLAGSVVIETVFSWPGMGSMLMNAVSARDVALVESTILIICLMFLIVNFAVDLLYHIIDPRITYE